MYDTVRVSLVLSLLRRSRSVRTVSTVSQIKGEYFPLISARGMIVSSGNFRTIYLSEGKKNGGNVVGQRRRVKIFRISRSFHDSGSVFFFFCSMLFLFTYAHAYKCFFREFSCATYSSNGNDPRCKVTTW